MGKSYIDTTNAVSINYSVTFTAKPTVVGVPAREKTDSAPQGDIRIRNVTISNFEAQVTNNTNYTTQSYFHWIAIGY